MHLLVQIQSRDSLDVVQVKAGSNRMQNVLSLDRLAEIRWVTSRKAAVGPQVRRGGRRKA